MPNAAIERRHDVNFIGPIDPETNTGWRVELLAAGGWLHLGTYGDRGVARERTAQAVSGR